MNLAGWIGTVQASASIAEMLGCKKRLCAWEQGPEEPPCCWQVASRWLQAVMGGLGGQALGLGVLSVAQSRQRAEMWQWWYCRKQTKQTKVSSVCASVPFLKWLWFVLKTWYYTVFALQLNEKDNNSGKEKTGKGSIAAPQTYFQCLSSNMCSWFC